MEGKYTGGTSKGESEDWKTMSKQVNRTLEQLSQKVGVVIKQLQPIL